MSLSGKNVIVTGAARNIGFQAAKHIAALGARVALVGRGREPLEAAAREIGQGAIAVPGDVTTPDEVTRILKEAADALGGLDGIVNNAGVAFPNKIENLDAAQVQEQMAINLFAPIMTCRGIIPYLRARGGGRIINVSSATVHTMDAFAHLSIYGATKAGLERFTKDLCVETRGDNIGVTSFIPGDTATGFGGGWDPQITGEAYKAWLDTGPYWNGMMAAEEVGAQIAHCMALPPNVTFEFVMMRPVGLFPKVLEADFEE